MADAKIVKHRQKQEENALSNDFKIQQLTEGVRRAEENYNIFTQKAQEQLVLKTQLEAEITQLKEKVKK